MRVPPFQGRGVCTQTQTTQSCWIFESWKRTQSFVVLPLLGRHALLHILKALGVEDRATGWKISPYFQFPGVCTCSEFELTAAALIAIRAGALVLLALYVMLDSSALPAIPTI